MVSEGDTLAIDIFNAYDKIIMPPHEFSEDEVWNLIGYIKKVSESKDYNEYFNIGPKQVQGATENKKPHKTWWVLILLGILSILTLFIVYTKKK